MTRVIRHIPFEGIANFRDVGGYKGVANQAVRWQRLYRSAHLAQASSTDLVSFRRDYAFSYFAQSSPVS